MVNKKDIVSYLETLGYYQTFNPFEVSNVDNKVYFFDKKTSKYYFYNPFTKQVFKLSHYVSFETETKIRETKLNISNEKSIESIINEFIK